jgi:bacterial leucyl aminopeptidase
MYKSLLPFPSLLLKFAVVLLLSIVFVDTNAQSRPDTLMIKSTIKTLAADSMRGRGPFTVGTRKAAAFIRSRMEKIGLQPFYPSYNDTVHQDEVNLVGYLPGKAENAETLVIGAHYDHIGIQSGSLDSIANGANDNASGVAALLAIAEHMSIQDRPLHNIVFVAFTLEEQGLYGSYHLANRWKKDELAVKAVINFDMLGAKLTGHPGKVYATGYLKSNLATQINEGLQDSLIVHLPDESVNLFRLSDNYPFYKVLQVPSHTFSTFNFKNYPFYHQVEDEPDALDWSNLNRVVQNLIRIIEWLDTSKSKIYLSGK